LPFLYVSGCSVVNQRGIVWSTLASVEDSILHHVTLLKISSIEAYLKHIIKNTWLWCSIKLGSQNAQFPYNKVVSITRPGQIPGASYLRSRRYSCYITASVWPINMTRKIISLLRSSYRFCIFISPPFSHIHFPSNLHLIIPIPFLPPSPSR
jgi:hypothetical protein